MIYNLLTLAYMGACFFFGYNLNDPANEKKKEWVHAISIIILSLHCLRNLDASPVISVTCALLAAFLVMHMLYDFYVEDVVLRKYNYPFVIIVAAAGVLFNSLSMVSTLLIYTIFISLLTARPGHRDSALPWLVAQFVLLVSSGFRMGQI